MPPQRVRDLERTLEAAIVEALRRQEGKPPQPRIAHLMAKAAVAVLEATEIESPPPPREP